MKHVVRLHELDRLCCQLWDEMSLHLQSMGEVQAQSREGDYWPVLFQAPQLPLPTSPASCPAFERHLQEVLLSLSMSPVVVHCRSSGMAAEVREGVTSRGGEEAAVAGPDSLPYKVTVVSHIHPEDGEGTSITLP